MTELETQIWNTVHNWCDAQSNEIPDQNRRYLMDEIKALVLSHVSKSLPNDECVEQWWAEGKDQQKGFWQEAPYRTNGDVVEEIKTALKYFIETWQR